jgi:hypothetical protein
MAKMKRTNNDLINTTHKAKDQITQTPLKTVDELGCFGRESSFCFNSGTHHVTLVPNPMISHE